MLKHSVNISSLHADYLQTKTIDIRYIYETYTIDIRYITIMA